MGKLIRRLIMKVKGIPSPLKKAGRLQPCRVRELEGQIRAEPMDDLLSSGLRAMKLGRERSRSHFTCSIRPFISPAFLPAAAGSSSAPFVPSFCIFMLPCVLVP